MRTKFSKVNRDSGTNTAGEQAFYDPSVLNINKYETFDDNGKLSDDTRATVLRN